MDNIFVNDLSSLSLKAASHDYTLKNGETLAFNVDLSLRSVTATDMNGATSGPVKELIATNESHRLHWDETAGHISTLREHVDETLPELKGAPISISDITKPLTTKKETSVDWSLQILSGNVQAEKSGDNAYKFTTTAGDDVEFTFKITADGIESKVFTALLKAEKEDIEKSPMVGKWELVSHTIINHISPNGAYVVDAGEEKNFYISLAEHGVDGSITMAFFTNWQKRYNSNIEVLQNIEIFQGHGAYDPYALWIKSRRDNSDIYEDGSVDSYAFDDSSSTGENSVLLDSYDNLVIKLKCNFITYMVIRTVGLPPNTGNIFDTNVEFVYRRAD